MELVRKLKGLLVRSLMWKSDTFSSSGPFREINEDHVCVAHSPQSCIAILADGVGGNNAGEVASSFVCNRLSAWFSSNNLNGNLRAVEQNLQPAILNTHKALFDQALATSSQAGMATTLALALQVKRKALIAWAGDSRVYHYRQGTLRQVSEDHSFVAEKVQQGVFTAEEAQQHPMGNLITSCLGAKQELPKLDIVELDLRENDALLLVSDGVSSVLSLMQLAGLISAGAQALVDAALAAGSRDNCSAIVINIQLESDARQKDK